MRSAKTEVTVPLPPITETTVEQIANELASDMQAIARLVRPYTEKWASQRKAEYERLNREITPEIAAKLRDASREMDKALGRFQ